MSDTKKFNKVIRGSHNTMSFLKPRHWWMRQINYWFAQCQESNSALSLGDAVDIRIYWSDEDGWQFAHGLVSYEFNSEFYGFFTTISKFYKAGVRYFRITLERNGNEDGFVNLCSLLENDYKRLGVTFLGGYRKSDWMKLYDFGTDHIPVHQWVGSMADDARWYEKFMPWAYAARMNGSNYDKAKNGINLYDFV